jgi:cAMP-dependent protein kinase regulator
MAGNPPTLPGGSHGAESPIDRALELALAGEREAGLRWAAAVAKADPAMPTALCLTGRLLGELGRSEAAREACAVAVARAIDLESLPLAVAAARELERFGGDVAGCLDRIAEAFCKGSARLGEGMPPPPPLPAGEGLQPLASVLTGALLLNKATEVVHEAKKALAEVELSPGIAAQPLFSSMSFAALRELCASFRPVWVPEGAEVIRQGELGSEAYFVARGELAVERRRGGDVTVLAMLTNGALFGEMALLSRAPRAASVIARRPSLVLEIKREHLDHLAATNPEAFAELAVHCRARMVQNLVRVSEVLRSVPPADRPALVARFQAHTFEAGEALLVQDQPPPGLHLIASGEVTVVRREQDGGEPLVLTTLGAGEVAGEVALVLRRRSSADAIALHPTVTLFLPASDFLALIDDHPAILGELYRIAVRRDEETSSIIAEEAVAADDFVLL